MLKFLVYENGRPATDWQMRSAHLLGAEDLGVRATIEFEDGAIICEKGAVGPASLALQFELPDVGDLLLQTCLLPERDEPYLLTLELARHRLMRCIAKQEDWGMLDLAEDHPAAKRLALAKRKFYDALCAMDEPAEADKLARASLTCSIDASEELALSHAESLLTRRIANNALSKHIFGCGVGLAQPLDRLAQTMLSSFDYIRLPMPWRTLEPAEQEYNWAALDTWCEWAFRNRLPILAGPVVSFTPEIVPDWLYIWEHDYDTVRDLLYEHVERVVTRYRSVVSLWNVVSGIHVNDAFSFNFEQLMDLTRMAMLLVKKIQPNARTLIEITHPFGEYYAANQRSIPPMMYAEMVLQSGIPVDGFGIKLLLGQPTEGQLTRDLMQVSSVLDKFSGLGKPMHVTAVGAPSQMLTDNGEDQAAAAASGFWRKPWNANVQGHWLEAFYNVTLSKHFVESVAWIDLADHDDAEMPTGGLIGPNFQPKPAFKRLLTMRKNFHENAPSPDAA
ncbi:hypothetical protein HED60_22875 [Planctomycetales bacterium ZRK34]|nr:hypothetical protein HED60_22875 [Planctomycetales bacterium ZRK34]